MPGFTLIGTAGWAVGAAGAPSVPPSQTGAIAFDAHAKLLK